VKKIEQQSVFAVNNKEKYRKYCTSHAVALYQNDWWLDAVCGANWDAVVSENDKNITSVFAFPYKKKYGLKLMQMPMLTLGLGALPAFSEELISQLPPFDLLDLYFLPGAEAGSFKGFRQSSRNTHRIPDLGDIEKVFSNFSSSTRQQVRKAEKKVKVSESNDVNALYKMVSMTFKRQDKKTPYTLAYVKNIFEACKKHRCCKILVAQDAQANIHGACLLAWDQQSAYYIMGGSDPNYKSSAAYSLLMWEAIREASKHAKEFDFCGSQIASIARFFKGFGGQETPYLHLKKVNSRALRIALALKGK